VKISDWLDAKEAENMDVSHITLPANMSYDEDPDETIFFKEIKPCGLFCTENHPFSTVERFGTGITVEVKTRMRVFIHQKMKWTLFTKDEDIALQTAKAHIE